MKRVVPILAVLALTMVLSSCSVATQDTATPLPPSLGLSPTTTPTTLPASQASKQLKVYFLRGGLLYPVLEYYATDPLTAALEALEIGPTATQADKSITTALLTNAQIRSAGVVTKKGVASIEVDQEFTTLPGESLEEAFAQVVFTVTGLPIGASSVQFFYAGSPLDALIPPGQLVKGAVTRMDYCAFAPASYLPCRKSTGTTGIT
jgi:spore germination protein GerM